MPLPFVFVLMVNSSKSSIQAGETVSLGAPYLKDGATSIVRKLVSTIKQQKLSVLLQECTSTGCFIVL